MAERIEQAVFTSCHGAGRNGYQLAATSPGVRTDDVRALSGWGPAHDALRGDDLATRSVQFHPLPSGAWCVARTSYQGAEYSGRGGGRVFTHSLIVPPDTFRRFANHPFRILDACLAAGRDGVPLDRPLEPIELPGRGSLLQASSLSRLRFTPGYHALRVLLRRVLRSQPLAVVLSSPVDHVWRALYDLLPLDVRPQVWSCTNLRPSARRPFRLCGLQAASPAECRHAERLGLTVLDLTDTHPPATHHLSDAAPTHTGLSAGQEPFAQAAGASSGDWADWVILHLETGHFAALAASLAEPPPHSGAAANSPPLTPAN
ncbi:MAG: hypothetical protein J5I93_03125 [Pirellulaceae bacterium]|nr:hypothetical protein [Pirellulaceae bacterium]